MAISSLVPDIMQTIVNELLVFAPFNDAFIKWTDKHPGEKRKYIEFHKDFIRRLLL